MVTLRRSRNVLVGGGWMGGSGMNLPPKSRSVYLNKNNEIECSLFAIIFLHCRWLRRQKTSLASTRERAPVHPRSPYFEKEILDIFREYNK